MELNIGKEALVFAFLYGSVVGFHYLRHHFSEHPVKVPAKVPHKLAACLGGLGPCVDALHHYAVHFVVYSGAVFRH